VRTSMPIPSSALIAWQRVRECGDLPTAQRRVRDHAGGFSATLWGGGMHARMVRDLARIWADSAHPTTAAGETLGRNRIVSKHGQGHRSRRTGRRRVGEVVVAEQEPIGATIRVVLVDDYLAFRQPLALILMREPDITIVGQAGSVAEARLLLAEADIVLIDLELPDGDGVDLLHELRTVNLHATALVLTGNATTEARARVVEAGAAGVLHKTCSVSEVVAAIRSLHAGKPLL
jgi:CheY-like chemotaxis protein